MTGRSVLWGIVGACFCGAIWLGLSLFLGDVWLALGVLMEALIVAALGVWLIAWVLVWLRRMRKWRP